MIDEVESPKLRSMKEFGGHKVREYGIGFPRDIIDQHIIFTVHYNVQGSHTR